jgi:phytoene synthase
VREDLASFVEKWAERDPAIRLVLLFAPSRHRDAVGLWFAQLRELEDAGLGRSSPQVAVAKLGFYAREFGSSAEAAHPLVRAWRERSAQRLGERLARELQQLMEFSSVVSAEALHDRLRPWAQTAAEAADRLFGERLSTAAIAADFLCRRLHDLEAEAARGRLWLPLDLLAAEGLDRSALAGAGGNPPLARVRARLARWWLARLEVDGGPVQAVLSALARLRLEQIDRGRPARWPPLRGLLRAWNAARSARRRNETGNC